MKSPFLRRFGMPSPFFDNDAGFSPRAIIGGSTALVWLDPSDLTTLFQDAAGTTPVTAPGQPVGLALDKSQGLVLGPELAWPSFTVVNALSSNGAYNSSTRTFSELTGATPSGDWPRFRADGVFTSNMFYDVTITFDSAARVGAVMIGAEGSRNLTKSGNTFRGIVQAAGTQLWVHLDGRTSPTSASVTSFSIRELPGFHATASGTSRPTYGVVPSRGRVNLTNFSQLVSTTVAGNQGYYVNNRTGTFVGSSGVVNDDTQTPEIPFYWRTTSTAYDLFGLTPSGALISGQTYTLRMRIRSFGSNITGFGNNGNWATSITSSSGFPVTSAEGWKDVTVVFVASNLPVIVQPQGNNSNWGYVRFQVELGSTVTTYQRVASQFEVTDPVGFPSYPCHYLQFDGVDDFMQTPTITPNADKVQVFAGLRKLSDAATGIVAELSTAPTDLGAFTVSAPNPTLANSFGFFSRGSLLPATVPVASFPAPTTRVYSGLGDISGDTGILRINGTQVAQSTADQGTGNYLAYPLYIGRRGGTSLPFNGQLFGLVVRFSPANLDARLISQTERWVAGKTPVDAASEVTWNDSTDTYTQRLYDGFGV